MKSFKHFFTPPLIAGRDLTVRGIGYREPMQAGIVDRPTGTKDYFFLYCYQSAYLNRIDKNSLNQPFTFIAWDPKQGHFYGTEKRRWQHTWMHCKGSLLDQWLRQTKFPLNTPFVVSDPSLVEKPFLECRRELTRSGGPDKTIVANIMENFIRGIAREVHQPQKGNLIPPAFVSVRHFLETNFEQKLSLAELAKRVHLSIPHFCAEFKRWYKTAPIEYVIQLRLEKAVYLLRNQNLRIGETAKLSGYEDVYHFSKLFKKQYGVSPKKMRESLLKER